MGVHLLLLTACAITVTDAYVPSATLNSKGPFISHVSDTGALSKPTMMYTPLGSNAMHITCFSESGPLPIRYQLFLYDTMLQEKVVNKSGPANFTITMSPGTQVYLNCTAISATGEKSSNIVKLAVDMDDSAVAAEETEIDHKEKDTGAEHLIPLQYILTSVTPDVLEWNTLLLITCGPILLFLLVVVIIISFLRGQKEQHMEA